MDRGLTGDPDVALARALGRIARVLLGDADVLDPRLGDLTLRPHQATAVVRLLEIISSFRGALLADAVGLGKTYVALAVAREFGNTLIVCPAALMPMWRRATAAAGVHARIVTVESLSRGVLTADEAKLVIVDEAHHFRNPATRRYEAIAHLARRARILLVSATPLHNARRDLTSLLALFAGSVVTQWTDEALARLIVRRDERSVDLRLPMVAGPQALQPAADDDCLEAILALPPPVPAADEGVAQALAQISLLHLWSSSRAALLASVRKRLARAIALRDAVAGGHVPTAAELSAWRYADHTLQLAFPLFAQDAGAVGAAALQSQLDCFIAAAHALVRRCVASPDPDAGRVSLLRLLRERHSGDRIVAFSQYAQTISAFGRLMRSDHGVACVTATGARIASGAVDRQEVLAQFAGGAIEPHPVTRIGLLLATDLLSEGIDLRGAAVVVNLDLPWNPARIEQRVGRARRLGSSQRRIHVYTFVPPAPAERMLQLRRRLTEKLRSARAVVGGDFDPFGGFAISDSPVAVGEDLRQCLRRWLSDPDAGSEEMVVGAAMAPVTGWLALATMSGQPRIVGDFGGGIMDDTRQLLPIVRDIGAAAVVNTARLGRAIDQLARWLDAREASAGSGEQPPSKRAVLERLSQTVARAPRHRRASVLEAAQRTRAALVATAGAGAERVMATLARSTADDDAWLQSVETFGALQAGDALVDPPRARIIALVLLERISPEGDATPG